MEQLIELSGKSKVILRAICDFETATHSFKAGDIVFSSSDTEISITNYENNKQIYQETSTVLASNTNHMSQIILSGVPMTTTMLELFSDVVKTEYDKLVIDNVYILDNTIYATQKVNKDKSYEIIGHKEIELTYDETTNSFAATSDKTIDDSLLYQLAYYSKKERLYYSLDNQDISLPYLSFEALTNGNNDKEDTTVYTFIPRVQLKANLVLNTRIGNIAYYTISLVVLNQKNKNERAMLGL